MADHKGPISSGIKSNSNDNIALTRQIFQTDDLASLNAVGKYIMNSMNRRENTTLLTSPPNYSIYLSTK